MPEFKLSTMKRLLIVCLLLSLVSSSAADSSTPDEFVNELKLVIATQNSNGMLALYHLRGSPQEFVAELKNGLPVQLASLTAVKSIKLVAAPASAPPSYARGGVLYGPNLEVKGIVEIRHGSKGITQLPYGLVDGKYRLAGVKKVGTAATVDTVRLSIVAPGYSLGAKLNGQSLSLGKFDSQEIPVESYLQKGPNSLVLTWRRSGGESPMSPEIQLIRTSSSGGEVWKKPIAITGVSGSQTLDFNI